MDAGAGGDGYFTLFKDGVIHDVVQASRYKVDQLDAISNSLATWKRDLRRAFGCSLLRILEIWNICEGHKDCRIMIEL